MELAVPFADTVTTETDSLNDTFGRLDAMLRKGTELGEGYFFEHFPLTHSSIEVDRLRFCNSGLVTVELRQATKSPDNDPRIHVDLSTAHPALAFIIEHEDGYWHSTRQANWLVQPTGLVKYAMLDFDTPEHGPVTEAAKRKHLSLVLGDFTVSKTLPTPVY